MTVARLVRGQLLSLKETEFVEAAQAIGVSDRKIVTTPPAAQRDGSDHRRRDARHPGAILAEATLAYIGIGVQPPRASWGSLDRRRPEVHPLRAAPRASSRRIFIALALISFTFLGDGLRDALDPKLKGKQ